MDTNDKEIKSTVEAEAPIIDMTTEVVKEQPDLPEAAEFPSRVEMMETFPDYFEWKLTPAKIDETEVYILSTEEMPIMLSKTGTKRLSVVYVQQLGRITLQVKHSTNELQSGAFVGYVSDIKEVNVLLDQMAAIFELNIEDKK